MRPPTAVAAATITCDDANHSVAHAELYTAARVAVNVVVSAPSPRRCLTATQKTKSRRFKLMQV